jgi:hypothetical protein
MKNILSLMSPAEYRLIKVKIGIYPVSAPVVHISNSKNYGGYLLHGSDLIVVK